MRIETHSPNPRTYRCTEEKMTDTPFQAEDNVEILPKGQNTGIILDVHAIKYKQKETRKCIL